MYTVTRNMKTGNYYCYKNPQISVKMLDFDSIFNDSGDLITENIKQFNDKTIKVYNFCIKLFLHADKLDHDEIKRISNLTNIIYFGKIEDIDSDIFKRSIELHEETIPTDLSQKIINNNALYTKVTVNVAPEKIKGIYYNKLVKLKMTNEIFTVDEIDTELDHRYIIMMVGDYDYQTKLSDLCDVDFQLYEKLKESNKSVYLIFNFMIDYYTNLPPLFKICDNNLVETMDVLTIGIYENTRSNIKYCYCPSVFIVI